MRKSLLMFAAGLMSLSASAKDIRHSATGKAQPLHKDHRADVQIGTKQNHYLAKATATPFYTQSFNGALPANWAVGSTTGSGTWKWFPDGQVSGSFYHIDAINTTTGGFMIYDSDSIGTASPGQNPVGWMRTESISCAGHSTVALRFDEYFRSFNDSCFVDVATNVNFTNATRYAVNPNNTLNGNDYVPTNPYNVFLNITSAAANQSTVYIRFYYYGPVAGGYSWQVDNITLAELDPVNVALHSSFLYNDSLVYAANYHSSIGSNVPLVFADSISPITMLDNMGATAQNGFTVTAKIFKNNVQVYNQSQTVASLPISGQDSIVEFPYYQPDAVGSYIVAFATNVAGNANTTQLVDTLRFNITDTLWTQYMATSAGSFDIHTPASQGEESSYLGCRFDVPSGASDTLTAISVAFGSGTTAGSSVQVQVYKLDNPTSNGWLPKYGTFTQALSQAEISTTSNIVFKTFPMQLDATYPILTEGAWAVVVTPVNVNPAAVVSVISSTPNPATGYAGYFGQRDTSNNNGNFDFGFNTEATGVTSIPLIRLHFATNTAVVGTKNITSNVNITQVYPNPANNSASITFTVAEDANVNVSVMNTVGQVLKAQPVGKISAGTAKTVTFSTADMPSGIYYYSVEVNGVRTTSRFVVGH